MSPADIPLHVRVAEALGCKIQAPRAGWDEWRCGCPEKEYERPHATHGIHRDCCHDREGLGCDHDPMARYDTDWSATGPLIEKYGIALEANGREWEAWTGPNEFMDTWADGPTPLIAVCNLLLALKEAGRLEP